MNLQTVAAQTNVRLFQVEAAVGLLDAGNTLPFIARYRKEATGGLDDEQLRQISRLLDSLRALEKRRQTILDSITAQGQITPELARQLHAATTLTELEDLYQPYKPKRRTRATVAREQGLQPLADLILAQPRSQESLDRLAAPFLNETIATADEAWAGARDIVAEAIGDHAGVRQQAREKALIRLVLQAVDDSNSITAANLDELRGMGWSDGDILDAVNHGARQLAADVVFNTFKIERDA